MQQQRKPSTVNVLGCLITALLLLSLSGCSWLVRDIEVDYTPVAKPELVVPAADEVRMRKVEWYIITDKNYEAVFNELRESGESVVLLGLTAGGYEAISLNLSDIRAFVQQQQAIIKAYKGYYVESEKVIDEANDKMKDMTEQE